MNGMPGQTFGAGGGGGGAIGQGAVAGEGGSGGEINDIWISREELEELKRQGFHHIEFSIGRGGNGATNGGGENGGDIIANLMTTNGRILRTITTKGGRGGNSLSRGAEMSPSTNAPMPLQ